MAGVCNVALRQTRAGELSMWKGCAFANAARNGVFAALLAAEGMTGPAPIFEGELGFMKLLTGAFRAARAGRRAAAAVHDRPRPTSSSGRPSITRRAPSTPPCSCARRSAIRKTIQAIDIHTFDAAVDIIGKDPEKWRPKTRETADHSLPYCTAVALVDGDVTRRPVRTGALHRPDPAGPRRQDQGAPRRRPQRALSARHPQSSDGDAERWPTTGARGRVPARPCQNPMTDAEVEQKFRTHGRAALRQGTSRSHSERLAGSWRNSGKPAS